MRLLPLFALLLLVPAAAAEVNHNPHEVDEGNTFMAWIDAEEIYEEVKFYVCTLEDPYTCYPPQKVVREDAESNGDGTYRYSFSHQVGDGVYPGYRYELIEGDNETKAPAEGESYPGLTIEDMQGSYYVRVDRKVAPPAEENEGLPAIALPVAAIAVAWVARRH